MPFLSWGCKEFCVYRNLDFPDKSSICSFLSPYRTISWFSTWSHPRYLWVYFFVMFSLARYSIFSRGWSLGNTLFVFVTFRYWRFCIWGRSAKRLYYTTTTATRKQLLSKKERVQPPFQEAVLVLPPPSNWKPSSSVHSPSLSQLASLPGYPQGGWHFCGNRKTPVMIVDEANYIQNAILNDLLGYAVIGVFRFTS